MTGDHYLCPGFNPLYCFSVADSHLADPRGQQPGGQTRESVLFMNQCGHLGQGRRHYYWPRYIAPGANHNIGLKFFYYSSSRQNCCQSLVCCNYVFGCKTTDKVLYIHKINLKALPGYHCFLQPPAAADKFNLSIRGQAQDFISNYDSWINVAAGTASSYQHS